MHVFRSATVCANNLRDPMRFNPDTVMPPFGKHKILTDQEIDNIVDYLYTL